MVVVVPIVERRRVGLRLGEFWWRVVWCRKVDLWGLLLIFECG